MNGAMTPEFGRTTSYELEATGKIKAVRVGKRRIVVTPPREFLISLAEQQAEPIAQRGEAA